MPGGRKNPLSASRLVERIGDVVHHGKSNAKEMAEQTKAHAEDKMFDYPWVDLEIQFIGASGIPRMDVGGSADPYFVAKLGDDKVTMVSTVKPNTQTPVWNEIWRVKNVPTDADLSVEVLDKDVGAPHDDFIGKFKTTVSPGAKEVEIEGPLFRRDRGTFWLKIESKQSEGPKENPFLFDGPIRYSTHSSPTVGALTNLNDARLYSTWKLYVMGIPLFFHDTYQPWNHDYKAAQSIFQGPTSIVVRSGIQAGHRLLYSRSTSNGFGTIEKAGDILNLLQGGERKNDEGKKFVHRVKPAVYTYIISAEDDSFRFSETGAAFFVDFASKHALHSNCAQKVRYSGEFHPRPQGGWANFHDETPDDQVKWELVIDNNSGTYAPDAKMLPALKALLEYNFPGFGIFALDHGDEDLKSSREACRDYAMKYRGIKQEELQPHAQEDEPTLAKQAVTFLKGGASSIENEASTIESKV